MNMLRKTLTRLKPGVPQRVHLLSAASLWTGIGAMLIVRGVCWLIESAWMWFILPALVLGTMKSLFILDRTVKRSLDRILRLADGTCLGAVYSPKTWMVIVLMMAAGYLLRHSTLPRFLLGTLYVTIGWALLLSSRHAWFSWYQGA
jgi:hypothetical protein